MIGSYPGQSISFDRIYEAVGFKKEKFLGLDINSGWQDQDIVSIMSAKSFKLTSGCVEQGLKVAVLLVKKIIFIQPKKMLEIFQFFYYHD